MKTDFKRISQMFKRNIIDAQRVHRTGRRRRFSISPFDQGNARAGTVSRELPSDHYAKG
jgi:hypothetical protein